MTATAAGRGIATLAVVVGAANATGTRTATLATCSPRDLDLPRGRERQPVRERDRVYEIDGTESRMLGTVGAFRVISENDLHDLRDESSNRVVAFGSGGRRADSPPYAQPGRPSRRPSILTTERYDNQRLEALQAAVGRLEGGNVRSEIELVP